MFRLNHIAPNLKKLVTGALNFLLLNGVALIAQLVALASGARLMSVAEFGNLMGAQSFFSIVAVFCGLGIQELSIREIARHEELLGGFLSKAVVWCCVSGVALSLTGAAAFNMLMFHGHKVLLCLLLGISEALLTPMVTVAESVHVASGSIGKAGFVRLIQASVRALATLGVCLVWAAILHIKISATMWAAGLLFSNCLVIIVVYAPFWKQFKKPEQWLSAHELRDGVFLALFKFFVAAFANLDRVLAMRIGSPASVGVYAAASRAIQFGQIPVAAVLRAAYAEFFRSSSRSGKERLRYMATVLTTALSAGSITATIGWLAAPLLPRLIGHQYVNIVPIFVPLLLTIPIYAINSSLADAMVGLDRYVTRLVIDLIGVVLLLALAIAGSARFGVYAIVFARIISGAASGLTYAICHFVILRRDARERYLTA